MEKERYPKGIYTYLPILYVIWADDLLSVSEIQVVKTAIGRDKSLDPGTIEQLFQWLDRDTPPGPEIQKHWLERIRASGARYEEDAVYPLTAFSLKVGRHYDPDAEINEDLHSLETNLGIQPNHYRHLFIPQSELQISSSYYDPKRLGKQLLGAQFRAYETFGDFLKQPGFQWEIRRDSSAYREVINTQLRLLADAGYGVLAYPEDYGGKSDMAAYAALFENLMFIDGSLCVKFGVQFGLFGGSIQKLGTKKHWDAYLSKAGTLDLPGCFAMTETRHGSNVRGIRTTATYLKKSGEIVIHTPGPDDNKEYIGNAFLARMATVFAQLIVEGTNRGVHAVLVPIRDEQGELLPGIRVEDNGYKLGLNGVDNGKIWFDEVHVPEQNLLDRYGGIGPDGSYQSPIANPNKRFFTMLGTLVGGRICVGKGALAGAKKALAIAVKYALRRRQFNDSVRVQEDLIMDYPSHQLRLLPRVASCYVYHTALDEQVKAYDSIADGDTRQLEAQVAGLKAIVTHFANTAIQECREACGGKGYLLENRIADLKGDVDIFTTFEGDNTVLLQLAAKGRLTDFRLEFNAEDFFGVLRLLSSQLAKRLGAINPAYVNKTDREHLYNPSFHRHAFNYRTGRLTYTLALRIRDYIKKGVPSYQAFLKVQSHLLALGRSYSEQMAYEAFSLRAAEIEEPEYLSLFNKLGTLHALSRIAEDGSWFMEQGYIGKSKSKAIKRRIERLCSELRPHANSLVDGFGIPNCLINEVPIVD